jgi:hypothetical protein
MKKPKRLERGQSIFIYAIMLPLMSLFILGLLDYMVTSYRQMEAIAIADLAAHGGAQEIYLRPDGKIMCKVDLAQMVAQDMVVMQRPPYIKFVSAVCGDSMELPFCRVTVQIQSAGYLFPAREIRVHAVGYLDWGVTREKQ